ncbi:acyltransferase [Klebsiella pneumoniae]|uniref:acyltransferase n=1 Tax=Klebsiella pneumoniae TaxID=573 RepID=UPI001C7DD0FD|nr:acyltransferase [Klebsiella pneumoniae]MCA5532086.1 acyltransferase [Klebsiella pneumoniae]MCQ8281163.1 acyltransferase [Klebsiella pneumoniae]MEB2423611.1 acyltransferase [Klebsiella pneumoniae]HBY3988699.1 acyltransferase [Klebsiella pneumoniae]HDZ9449794.1 acyltransferase [Klebsiella pneumoniae]
MIGKLIRYFISFCYCGFLKLKYRQKLIINSFKVYISILSEIKITGTGKVQIDSSKGRVYISPYSSIVSSGGNIYIGSGVFFNKNVNVVSHDNIYIGENCLFGHNICCFDSDHRYNDLSKDIRYQGYAKSPVRIERNVWICAGVMITKGTIIGENSVIAGNSVARGSLRQNSIYAGIPCKFIKEIS